MTKIAPFPTVDNRRANRIYDELMAIARTAIPNWKAVEDEGDFAHALLHISAELSEFVVDRIDRTPERDAIAFFSMLDIPLDAARPALVPLVFTLAKNRNTPVYIQPGIQVGAKTDSGEIIFETTKDLNLTPANLIFLGAVDGSADIIEQAPVNFLQLEPQPVLPEFRTLTFTEVGSNTIQISPAEGLEVGDDIRINDIVYRITNKNENLFHLRESIQADIAKNVPVTKATDFALYNMRNIQNHTVYIGHEELLNLEEPSTINVQFQPPELASKFNNPGCHWELFSTIDQEDDPRLKTKWQKLLVIENKPGELTLLKHWRGKVEKQKVNDLDNLWLRVKYTDPVFNVSLFDESVNHIKLKVKTLEQIDLVNLPKSTNPCELTVNTTDIINEAISSSVVTEGSSTIDLAFHNANPLPLTTRFLPFGREPQRFETFSIAAPEVFSKKQAEITLDVNLADASIVAMAPVYNTATDNLRAYAISANRNLQKLILSDPIVWHDIGHPETKISSGLESNLDLELDSRFSPQPIAVDSTMDVVFVRDKRYRYWAWVDRNETENSFWLELPELVNASSACRDIVVFKEQAKQIMATTIVDNKLQYLTIELNNFTAEKWLILGQSEDIEPTHNIGANSRLIRVEKSLPKPNIPEDEEIQKLVDIEAELDQFVILDEAGDLWQIVTESKAIENFQKLTPNKPKAHTNIKPAAILAYSEAEQENILSVLAADSNSRQLFSQRLDEIYSDPNGVVIFENTAVQLYPTALNYDVFAVAFGTISGLHAYSAWNSKEQMFTSEVPYKLDKPSGFVIPGDTAPSLLISGIGERIHRNFLFKKAEYELYHPLYINTYSSKDFILKPKTDANDKNVLPISRPIRVSEKGPYFFPIAQDSDVEINKNLKLFIVLNTHSGQVLKDNRDKLVVDNDDEHWLGQDTIVIEDELYTIEQRFEDILTAKLDRPIPQKQKVSDDEIVKYSIVKLHTESAQIAAEDERRLTKVMETNLTLKSPQYLRFQLNTINGDPVFTEKYFGWVVKEPGFNWVLLSTPWPKTPGAKVSKLNIQYPDTAIPLQIIGADGGQWRNAFYPRGFQNPELAWEYFNGKSWRRLESDEFFDETENFGTSGKINFTVPDDIAEVDVAGQKDYWVRARLIGGDYGRPEFKVTTESGSTPADSTQKVVVDTSKLRPPEIIQIEASFKTTKFDFPHRVLVDNNLDVRDQTQANQNLAAEYNLFEGAIALNQYQGDVTWDYSQRVLYFGFTKSLQGQLTIFVDAVDQDTENELIFEVLAQDQWRHVTIKDETKGLAKRGFIYLSINNAPRLARLFGRECYWLRARPRTHGNWQPNLKAVFANAVLARQARSLTQEVLGSSIGEPNLRLKLAQSPVLTESLTLRVLETLTDDDIKELSENLDFNLVDDDESKPVQHYDEISLTGDWVLWQRVDSFIGQSPDARVYRLDAQNGVVEFGDDRHGRIPPAGNDNIRAIRYQTGGGANGNVSAYSVDSLKSAVESVEKVLNPVPAAGGTDFLPVETQIHTAPDRIRRKNRALTPPDIESLVVSSNPSIVRARCLYPNSSKEGIKIAVCIRTGERCPIPSKAHQQAIGKLVYDHAWGALGDNDVKVIAPEYVAVKVVVTVVPVNVEQAATLEKLSNERLRLLLHPVEGGPKGQGWPFGRRIWESDVLRALSELPGFDRLDSINISPVVNEHELNKMSPTALICAEHNDITVTIEFDKGEV